VTDLGDRGRPWQPGFEQEVGLQRRAETMLMVRGAVILVVVTLLVVARSLLL
jgi:hypothetical protein